MKSASLAVTPASPSTSALTRPCGLSSYLSRLAMCWRIATASAIENLPSTLASPFIVTLRLPLSVVELATLESAVVVTVVTVVSAVVVTGSVDVTVVSAVVVTGSVVVTVVGTVSRTVVVTASEVVKEAIEEEPAAEETAQ